MDELYSQLNERWKSSCSIVIGQEIGELKAYEKYLKEGLIGKKAKSIFSGKDIFVSSVNFPKGARFYDYANEQGKYLELNKPFDINKIKDMDSLVELAQERFIYASGKVLGNSSKVELSDNISDSACIMESSLLSKSKYMAYCVLMLDGESCFGSVDFTNHPTNLIRCFYGNSTMRSFECAYPVSSSDCIFCYNVENCANCMFTFSAKNSRNKIGNVQLAPDEYKKLSTKLKAEICEVMEKMGRYPISIVDML